MSCQLYWGVGDTRKALRGVYCRWNRRKDVAEVVFAARNGQRGVGELGVEGDGEY